MSSPTLLKSDDPTDDWQIHFFPELVQPPARTIQPAAMTALSRSVSAAILGALILGALLRSVAACGSDLLHHWISRPRDVGD